MAPYSLAVLDHFQHQFEMETRDLGKNATGTPASLTSIERNTLQILALIFSTISVASSVIAFYWFVKMRRSFRHDLIMLLIQSDMFKALFFMLYPIVVFSQGPVTNHSRFCQVNGFFVSVGVEASDFAILQIAIHTALYIFKPKIMGGEGGLYPYRYFAYFGWLFFPLLMASLAFVNDQDAYVVEGTYCYLPVRPFWYRLALGWIPRYVIFIVILFIYASIYYYVRYKFHGFTMTGKSSYTPNPDSLDSVDGPRRLVKRHTLPATPTLARHGLIPESRQVFANGSGTLRKSVSVPDQQHSSGDGYSRLRRDSATHHFMWSSFVAKNTPLEVPTPPSTPIAVLSGPPSPTTRPVPEDTVPAVPTHAGTMPLSSTNDPTLNSVVPTPLRSRTSWRDVFARRVSPDVSGKPSIVDMFAALRRGPDNISDLPTPLSQLELVNSRSQNIADVEMHRTREKIRRQLRFLFIYPLVYMGMWIVPFLSHVLQYDDRFAVNPPFPLICLTTIFVCSQAAVDCWLFSTREKPWRHMPGHDGTFWGSFGLGSGLDGPKRANAFHGPGMTREEMNRDARAAYQRRDEERAQASKRREALKGVQLPKTAARGRWRRGGSDWWDIPGYDGRRDTEVTVGGMSTVAEEVVNPIDGRAISKKECDEEQGNEKESKSKYPGTGEPSPVFKTISFQDPTTPDILHKQ